MTIRDVGEKQNVAAQHPDVVQALLKLVQQARDEVGDVQEIPPGKRL